MAKEAERQVTSPQPLSKVKGGRAGRLWFSHLALQQMSGPSHMVAQTIAKWAYVEAAWGAVLAKFLGAEAETAIAMYASLNGFASQRMALEAAAKLRLDQASLDIFSDVITAVSPFATTRHHFAHWLWGSTPTRPGDALLVEPQHVWKHRARTEAMMSEHSFGFQDFPEFDRSLVQVWSPAALMQAQINGDLAVDLVMALITFLNEPEGRKRDHICNQLYAQEIVAKARTKRLRRSFDQQEPELLPRQPHTSDVY